MPTNDQVQMFAWSMKHAIESGGSPEQVSQAMQDLVFALGGTADARNLAPGAAALYVLALSLAAQSAA